MTKLILTRHGHVEGIEPPRFRGRAALPLTELGLKQAKALALRIANKWRPTKVYTSPMERCVKTGQEIADICGIASEVLDQLNDLDYGQWQMRTYDDVRTTCPKEFSAWLNNPHLVRFPDGESLQDLVARAADALRFALERHPRETDIVVFVGHDSVNRALLLQLIDQPLSAYWRAAQSPCAISEIDIVGDCVRLESMNETGHLESLG